MSYSNYGDSKPNYPMSGQYSNNKHEYGGDVPYSGLYTDSLLNLLQGPVSNGPAPNPDDQQRLLLSLLQQQAANMPQHPTYPRGSYRDSDMHMQRGSGPSENYGRNQYVPPRSDWNRPPPGFDYDRRYNHPDQPMPQRDVYNKMRPSDNFRDKRMHEELSMRGGYEPVYDLPSSGGVTYDPLYSRRMPPRRAGNTGGNDNSAQANPGVSNSAAPPTSSSKGTGNRFSSRSDSSRSENKLIQTRKYTIKINVNLVNIPQWEFTEMKKRFSQLYLSDYVSRVMLDWTQKPLDLRLDIKVPIRVASLPESQNALHVQNTLNSRPEVIPGKVQYWIKIMLLSGLPYQSYDSLIRPQNLQLPKSAFNKDDSVVHLSQNIKFLVVRRQQCRLCAVGGLYDPEIDGSDHEDPKSFERAAIRIAKEQFDLDLSGCSKWNRFVSIEYAREGANVTDVSVYMIPTAWEVIPESEVCSRLWKMKKLAKLQLTSQRQIDELVEKQLALTEQLASMQKPSSSSEVATEDPFAAQLNAQLASIEQQLVGLRKQYASLSLDSITKVPPTEPHLLVTVRGAKLRECQYVPISLEGLLDYSFENDREEEVMELSIFAEAFWNYLQYNFGKLIMSALEYNLDNYLDKAGLKNKSNEKKREVSTSSSTSPVVKKPKVVEDNETETATASLIYNPETEGAADAPSDINVEITTDAVDKAQQQSTIDSEQASIVAADVTASKNSVTVVDDAAVDKSSADESSVDAQQACTVDSSIADESVAVHHNAASEPGSADEKSEGTVNANNSTQVESKSNTKPTFTVSYHYHQNLNMPLLRAFHFFDRNRTGSLRAEDLEHLLYSLGAGFTRHYVTELILKADVIAPSGRFEKKKKISFDHMVKQHQPLSMHAPT